MELRQYFYMLKKRSLFITIITLFFMIFSALITTFFITKTYESDISVIVGKEQSSSTSAETSSDIVMYQQLVKTYTQIAKSRVVVNDVISKLNLNKTTGELLGNVTITATGDTEFIKISVTSKDPEEAAKLANQWALSLKENAKKIIGTDNIQLVDNALVPTNPSSPNLIFNIAAAVVLGLSSSVGISLLLEYLDNTIKSEEDISNLLNITILGSIPQIETKD